MAHCTFSSLISVFTQDPFVMEHWAADQRAVNIRFLAGNDVLLAIFFSVATSCICC